MGEFRKRFHYSIHMRQQPSTFGVALTRRLGRNTLDKMFARFAKNREKRLLPCFNLKDSVIILDQENGQDRDNRVVTTKGSALRIRRTGRHSQYHLSHASFLSYLKSLLYTYCLVAIKDPIDEAWLTFFYNPSVINNPLTFDVTLTRWLRYKHCFPQCSARIFRHF